VQPFDPLPVYERDVDDRGHLAQQSQHIEPVPLVRAFAPRQLYGPLQLVRDVVEKALDLSRRRACFCVQPLGQRIALIAISEPRLARPIGEQRHNDRDEERSKIFPEERPSRPGLIRSRGWRASRPIAG